MNELLTGQKSPDHHDILAMVFWIKEKNNNLITKELITGETLAYMYTVEWQKVPSAHPYFHMAKR